MKAWEEKNLDIWKGMFIMTNDTIKTLLTRRSVRAYKPQQIKAEELDTILEAGSYAPSGMNKQCCTIVSLQSPELIEEAANVNPDRGGLPQYYGAKTVVLVFADKELSPTTYALDAAAIITNMINAAHSIGVDSCWINIPAGSYDCEKGRALLNKLNLDEKLEGVASIVLGYADGDYPEVKPRKENYIMKF